MREAREWQDYDDPNDEDVLEFASDEVFNKYNSTQWEASKPAPFGGRVVEVYYDACNRRCYRDLPEETKIRQEDFHRQQLRWQLGKVFCGEAAIVIQERYDALMHLYRSGKNQDLLTDSEMKNMPNPRSVGNPCSIGSYNYERYYDAVERYCTGISESKRQAVESVRRAEEARKAEQARQVEEMRKAEEALKTEAARQAEQARKIKGTLDALARSRTGFFRANSKVKNIELGRGVKAFTFGYPF